MKLERLGKLSSWVKGWIIYLYIYIKLIILLEFNRYWKFIFVVLVNCKVLFNI